jgi:hypothetical protein
MPIHRRDHKSRQYLLVAFQNYHQTKKQQPYQGGVAVQQQGQNLSSIGRVFEQVKDKAINQGHAHTNIDEIVSI